MPAGPTADSLVGVYSPRLTDLLVPGVISPTTFSLRYVVGPGVATGVIICGLRLPVPVFVTVRTGSIVDPNANVAGTFVIVQVAEYSLAGFEAA